MENINQENLDLKTGEKYRTRRRKDNSNKQSFVFTCLINYFKRITYAIITNNKTPSLLISYYNKNIKKRKQTAVENVNYIQLHYK